MIATNSFLSTSRRSAAPETAYLALCAQAGKLLIHLLADTPCDRLRFADRQRLRRTLSRVETELATARKRLIP